MGRPKNIQSAERRSLLLRAAEHEFGTVGYHRARLEDVAAAVGIRRPSLLYHFGSKEQLYREVVTQVSADFRQEVVTAIESPGEIPERLRAVAEALLGFADRRRDGVSMFVRELLESPPGGEENIREFVAIIDLLEEFLCSQASHLLPEKIPIRAALLHILTSQALRVASGDLQEILWGESVDPRLFVQALLMGA